MRALCGVRQQERLLLLLIVHVIIGLVLQKHNRLGTVLSCKGSLETIHGRPFSRHRPWSNLRLQFSHAQIPAVLNSRQHELCWKHCRSCSTHFGALDYLLLDLRLTCVYKLDATAECCNVGYSHVQIGMRTVPFVYKTLVCRVTSRL